MLQVITTLLKLCSSATRLYSHHCDDIESCEHGIWTIELIQKVYFMHLNYHVHACNCSGEVMLGDIVLLCVCMWTIQYTRNIWQAKLEGSGLWDSGGNGSCFCMTRLTFWPWCKYEYYSNFHSRDLRRSFTCLAYNIGGWLTSWSTHWLRLLLRLTTWS